MKKLLLAQHVPKKTTGTTGAKTAKVFDSGRQRAAGILVVDAMTAQTAEMQKVAIAG